MKKILIIHILLILNITFLSAEESREQNASANIPIKKEKVAICFFQDKSKTDKFNYLSPIIPYAITKDINRIGEYEAETYPAKMDYIESGASDEEKKASIGTLAEKSKVLKTAFMIIGSYQVEEKKITILTQLFDAEMQRIVNIGETESRLSAVVLEMIEEATNRINAELRKATEEIRKERARQEEDRKAKISPFLGLYNTLSGFTFGFNYGRINFLKDMDIFKDTDQASGYLSYELRNIKSISTTPFFNNLALTGSFDYFYSRTKESYNNSGRDLEMEVTAGKMMLSYLFRMSPDFNIASSAGGGVADLKIEMQADKENGYPAQTLEDSSHPYYSFSLSMNFYFSSLRIESGCSYNVINLSPKDIKYMVLYFGLGCRI
ncbi:MAG: hypothetical protein V1874_10515 [Spirochaetota bacterium]